MKKLACILIVFACCVAAKAQVRVGDMLLGVFDDTKATKLYVAEVLSVDGPNFSCRFVHSGNVYTFVSGEKRELAGLVATAKVNTSGETGAFKKGTEFWFSIYRPEELDTCSWMKVTFRKDNKSYLATFDVIDGQYHLNFTHSNSNYVFSNEGIVVKSGGTYKKGDEVQWICASEVDLK